MANDRWRVVEWPQAVDIWAGDKWLFKGVVDDGQSSSHRVSREVLVAHANEFCKVMNQQGEE